MKAKKDGDFIVSVNKQDQQNLEKERFQYQKASVKYQRLCEEEDLRNKNQFKRFVRNLDIASNTIDRKHYFPSDQQIRKIAVNEISSYQISSTFNLRENAHITPNRNLYMLKPKVSI